MQGSQQRIKNDTPRSAASSPPADRSTGDLQPWLIVTCRDSDCDFLQTSRVTRRALRLLMPTCLRGTLLQRWWQYCCKGEGRRTSLSLPRCELLQQHKSQWAAAACTLASHWSVVVAALTMPSSSAPWSSPLHPRRLLDSPTAPEIKTPLRTALVFFTKFEQELSSLITQTYLRHHRIFLL